jgi:hypothetical protein
MKPPYARTVGWISLERLAQDLRHALRSIRLNPAFATVAILSFALGIGANTAIFQLLYAVRLSSLPVKNPRELVQIRLAEGMAVAVVLMADIRTSPIRSGSRSKSTSRVLPKYWGPAPAARAPVQPTATRI